MIKNRFFMDYRSLAEISRKHNLSQDYLRILVLRKKLKAVKVGRNWHTTDEWIQEYLAHAEEWKKFLKENGVPGARARGERTVLIKRIPYVPPNAIKISNQKERIVENYFSDTSVRAMSVADVKSISPKHHIEKESFDNEFLGISADSSDVFAGSKKFSFGFSFALLCAFCAVIVVQTIPLHGPVDFAELLLSIKGNGSQRAIFGELLASKESLISVSETSGAVEKLTADRDIILNNLKGP